MQPLTHKEINHYFKRLLGPDRSFYWLAAIYTIAISLLTLAVPISVQTLISTVANTALLQPIVVLGVLLFILLILSGLLTALRTYVMELFRRRIYARLTSEIVLRTLQSDHQSLSEQNQRSLFNRYFDIMTLQKSIPKLLVGGLALCLQALVGFTVVALYHPVFLLFNLALIICLYLVWRIWGPRAIDTGIELSHSKYEMADWLESLAENDRFFRATNNMAYAKQRTDKHMSTYIGKHKKHFRKHFAQTLALLFLYATASSVLLGLGGWLVIRNELTLGQLVAAELIMTAIFYGLSQAGNYLDTFYDLCAGIEELSLFLRIPLEQTSQADQHWTDSPHIITFNNVTGRLPHGVATVNLTVPAGALVHAKAERYSLQEWFTHLHLRHHQPDAGQLLIGGQDVLDIAPAELRQEIIVLDNSNMLDSQIADYLELANAASNRRQQREILQELDMATIIDELPDGWRTEVNRSGLPLTQTETLRLQLAAALLARPRLLILTQAYDVLSTHTLRRLLRYLRQQAHTTCIAFTRHDQSIGWTHRLNLGVAQQSIAPTEPDTLAGHSDQAGDTV